MLDKLRQLFSELADDAVAVDQDHLAKLAATALLLEVSHADHDVDPRETRAILSAAKRTFGISADDLQAFFNEAELQKQQSTSLYEFTDLVNQRFDEAQKYHLVCQLWRVAYADGELDRYEDHTIRKIAELIYVSHSAFIKAKHEAAALKKVDSHGQ